MCIRDRRKEVLWRACLNNLLNPELMHREATAAGAPPPPFARCPCGGAGSALPGRRHIFWGCAAARAVRAALQTQLTAELTPLQLLVGEAPAGVHAGVWAAVRLAAFNALWRAREFYRRAMEPGEAEQPVNAPDVTERGRHMAVQYFWADLEEFVEEQPPPPRWRRQVGAAHPFIFLQHPAAQLRVRRT